MAHIVVYLQRTARGLHPGSLVSLSMARDIANARGCSVLSVCLGDAGAFDDRVIVQGSSAGADQIVFLGPAGIQKLFNRLMPRHVFAPYTREAGSVLAQAGIGPMVGRWVSGPVADPSAVEAAVGVVAGALPWVQAPLQIEPEYEADVTQVELDDWLVKAVESATSITTTVEQPSIMYVANEELDDETKKAASSIGAYPIEANKLDFAKLDSATLLWFDAKGEGLPTTLFERGPGVRVILLTGERDISGPMDASWGMADFVLSGPWAETVTKFNGQAWKTMFA